jgi:Flp pilus assembly protein TadD
MYNISFRIPGGESSFMNLKFKLMSLFFDKVIQLDPNDVTAWDGKGIALLKLGRCMEAIQAFDKAIQLDTNDAMAWSNKGTALSSLGKHEEAIQAFDKAIQLNSYRRLDR